jgi:hypothetical protein
MPWQPGIDKRGCFTPAPIFVPPIRIYPWVPVTPSSISPVYPRFNRTCSIRHGASLYHKVNRGPENEYPPRIAEPNEKNSSMNAPIPSNNESANDLVSVISLRIYLDSHSTTTIVLLSTAKTKFFEKNQEKARFFRKST